MTPGLVALCRSVGDAASLTRWVSFIVCVIFTLYFTAYHLYIYNDMTQYPSAVIGSHRYEYYLIRYGTFLKNIRFEEYESGEEWSVRQWLRPYNYHILSYYKKFTMLIALPIFYEFDYVQVLLCPPRSTC